MISNSLLSAKSIDMGVSLPASVAVDLQSLAKQRDVPLRCLRLTEQEELNCFRQLQFCRRQTREQSSEESRLRWLRLAEKMERDLAEVHFKLAVSVAVKFARDSDKLDDLVSQSCVTLLRAITLFDIERGNRFSTYVTRAIRSELARCVARRKRHPQYVDPHQLRRLVDPKTDAWSTGRRTEAVRVLDNWLDQLETREAYIVRRRFGFGRQPRPATLQSLADEFGISRERVRQVERRAMNRLQAIAGLDAESDLLP